ncbi:hypothetical protein P692DRAFT_201935700 [Suillus brevipes Sb2]|nr:hypothetical protein P692DRAFT_201935700 [Suillus brevipes Sb2]
MHKPDCLAVLNEGITFGSKMPRLPKIILLDLASFKRHGIEHKRRGRKGDQHFKKLYLTFVLFLTAGRVRQDEATTHSWQGGQVPVCELTLEGLAVNTRCGYARSESIKGGQALAKSNSGCPVTASQRRTVPSQEPDARRVPSGENETQTTSLV